VVVWLVLQDEDSMAGLWKLSEKLTGASFEV
jgi:hypothetical protein